MLSRTGDEQACSEEQIQLWQGYCSMTDEALEATLINRWLDQQFTQPAFWNNSAFNVLSQSVVGVCWFEARAYCNWLSHQTGQSFRLPSEAQWEASVSGRDAHSMQYTGELRRTTPVGVFSAGDTPFQATENGVSDLSGNIWEWNSSCYMPHIPNRRMMDVKIPALKRLACCSAIPGTITQTTRVRRCATTIRTTVTTILAFGCCVRFTSESAPLCA